MNMKIKILRGDRGKWYYNTDNIGKEFRDIEYIGSSSFRFLIKGSYWVDKDDCVITELPESFCVKRCDDGQTWEKYIQWLNKTYNHNFNGFCYHGYYGNNDKRSFDDNPFGTEIHIDDMIKHIDFYSEPMVIESKDEFDMNTNEGRQAYAIKYYPYGTKYRGLDLKGNVLNRVSKVNRTPYYNHDDNIDAGSDWIYIHKFNKWAEIVEVPKDEFDMTTNEGRLAYAKRNYPVGTKYKSIVSGQELIVGDYDGHLYGQPENIWLIYYNGKWAEIIDEVTKEEEKMETNLLELIRLFPELPTDYAKKLVQKVLEVKEGNLINLANFIGSADTPTPFYEIITGSKSEQKANYVWRKIYDFKNKKTNMETQRLSRQGLKEIHSIACSNWKVVLERYGANSPLEDYIELTQEQVNNMFKACTKEQLPIVSKYLKQDDGSVDLSNIKYDESGARVDGIYILRHDDFDASDNNSFWLNNNYDWILKVVKGDQRLYPTKKK